MNAALVRLDDVPQMTLCAICPEPGHCCSSFYLYTREGKEVTVWADSLDEELPKRAPFVPTIKESFTVTDAASPDFGRAYVSVLWSCPKLGALGRCTIYENRPQVCRNFVPGDASPLCVFHPQNREARAGLRKEQS